MPPPMILFDLKTTPKRSTLDLIPKGWGVGNTERGWMTSESFFGYISNIFFKWLKKNNYVFPVVLYVDGHSCHMTLPLMKFCKENLIQLVVLYPNATHIIQPLDVAVFRPLKESYRKVLRQWRVDNNVIDMKKSMFAPVLEMALDDRDFSKCIINGFRTCGLYPFNANAVNYKILSKKSKKKVFEVQPVSISDSVQSSDLKNLEMLEFYERNILPSDTLEAFRSAESEDVWSGDLENHGLFASWRKLKRLCIGMYIFI